MVKQALVATLEPIGSGILAQADVTVLKHRTALIAAGSNLASTDAASYHIIVSALRAICKSAGQVVSISRFYRTPAYPAGSGPDFVNAACAVSTALAPRELLDLLHGIEAGAGRVRDRRWGPRTLDLDLVAMEEVIRPSRGVQAEWMSLAPDRQGVEAPGELILPHPRLQDRAFVLIPLADIRPNWRHPATGLSVSDMLAALPEADKAAIRPI